MPAGALLALTAVAALVVFVAPLRWGFAVFLLSVLLVPATMVVPMQPLSYLTVQVVLLGALALSLLVRLNRRVPMDAFALSPVHGAFLFFLAALLLFGVVLASPAADAGSGHRLFAFGAQFATFVVALACIRLINDDAFVLRTLAVGLGLAALVAVAEHVTGHSYAQGLFFAHTSPAAGAGPLATRLGHVRVRAAAQFSVEFAWVSAALLPLLVVTVFRATRWWRLVGAGALVAVVLAGYWSYTRSVVAPLAIVLATFAVWRWRRRGILLVGAALALALVVVVTDPALTRGFTFGADVGSITSRTQRIQLVLSALVGHSWHGLGLSALTALGLQSTDNSYLLLYAEVGVLGLTAFVVLLVAVLGSAGRVLQPGPDRAAGGAALAGLALLVVSGFAMDQVAAVQSTYVFWVLAALAVAVAERHAEGSPGWRPVHLSWRRTMVAPAAAAAVAGLVFVLTPLHVAQTYLFTTVAPYDEAADRNVTTAVGDELVNTTCGLLAAERRTYAAAVAGTGTSCQNLFAGVGIGAARIQGATVGEVQHAALAEFVTASTRPELSNLQLAATGPPVTGRPTAPATVLGWLPLLVLGVATFAPFARARRDGRHVG